MSQAPSHSLSSNGILSSKVIAYFTLGAVGFALFFPTFGFELSNHDDTALITNSQPFLNDAANFLRVFLVDPFRQLMASAGGVYYRPVLWQSFMPDAGIGGANPAIYHVSNLVYHLIASVLVFQLLLSFDHSQNRSLFFALAFLVHPTLAHATAWTPGRNDALLAIFVVATILSLREFFANRGWGAFACAVLFWNFTLYTKEAGLFVAGLAVILVGFHALRSRALPTHVIPLGALFVLSTGVWFVLRRSALGAFPLFFSNIPDNLEMFIVYIGKALIPVQLSVVPSTEDSSLVPGLLVILFVSAGIFLSRHRRIEPIALGIAWFLAGLAPALLAPSPTRGLEHRLYTPAIGLILVLAEFNWMRPNEENVSPSWAPRVQAAAAIALVLGFAALTALRLPDYRNPRSYWQSAYRDSPSSVEVQSGLCRVEITEEHWAQATAPCEAASKARPRDSTLQYLLGWVYLEQNRAKDAETSLRESVRLDGTAGYVWQKLAEALEAQGRHAEARSARSFQNR